jgi:DNA replication protein DnaC
MNTTQTLSKLNQMRLYGMENALRTVTETHAEYQPEELAAYLAEAEWNDRETRRMNRYLKQAGFRYQASVEEVDFLHPRDLDQRRFTELADCSYLDRHRDILLTGPTGTGKSFLASALGHQACIRGYRVRYFSTGKLFEKLHMTRATGAHHKFLRGIERADLLILDDFGLWPLEHQHRLDLLEIIEDRHGRRSTLIASQIPVSGWHELIGEKTIADAILDRLVHNAHRITLKGESMRRTKAAKAT